MVVGSRVGALPSAVVPSGLLPSESSAEVSSAGLLSAVSAPAGSLAPVAAVPLTSVIADGVSSLPQAARVITPTAAMMPTRSRTECWWLTRRV